LNEILYLVIQTISTDSIVRIAQRVAGAHVSVGFALHIRIEKEITLGKVS
jgi:hypothetical protein